jgi:hypothetical protein
MIKPSNIVTASNSYLRQSKYFSFPGFIKQLKFPSWERYVNIVLNQQRKNNLYLMYFYKAAFLD